MINRKEISKRHYQKHLKQERERRYLYFTTNKKDWWKWRVKREYGLEPEEYLEILEKQKGVCAICKTKKDELCVDHDHVTGKVRGMLCKNCNVGLGHFQDNIDLMKVAIKYLRKNLC